VGVHYHAAWVPQVDDEDWDVAADLGVDWVLQQADAGLNPVVVTASRHLPGGPIEWAARRFHHVTPRARFSAAQPSRPRAVLAYTPDARCFDVAADLAHGGALCVVEGLLLPLSAWAARLGAEDLHEEPVVLPELDPRLVDWLQSLAFYCGRNYVGGPTELRQVRRTLDELQRAGLLDPDIIRGVLMAEGMTAEEATRVHREAEKRLERGC
jgi:hypothetical protein